MERKGTFSLQQETIGEDIVGKSGKSCRFDNVQYMRNHLRKERTNSSNKLAKDRTLAEVLLNPLHPEATGRITWDCIILIIIIYCAVVVPVDLGLGGLEGQMWRQINLFMIVIFSMDVFLNFKTAYYDSYGKLERRYACIAKQYIRSWFLLDLFSTIPFDIILSSYNMKGTVLMRLPRVVKMVRLARLMRLAKISQVVRNIFGLHIWTSVYLAFLMKFGYLLSFLLLIAHWLGCSFAALSEISENDPYEGVVKQGWNYAGISASELTKVDRYQAAFYFAFCSMLGPKPPDITFETRYCRYFYMLFGFIRPLVNASIMGVLTSLIVSQNSKKGNFKRKMHALGVFMQQNNVKKSIQHQVFAYLEHAEKQISTLHDLEAINSLSPTLKEEVAYRTLKGSIKSCKIFKMAFGKQFVQQICLVLRLDHRGPDDIICQQGHYLQEMFFVNFGHLQLFFIPNTKKRNGENWNLEDGPEVKDMGKIGPGMNLGALALLQHGDFESSVSVLCFEFVELAVLTKKDFMRVVSRNSEWIKTLRKISSFLCVSDNSEEVLEEIADGDNKVLNRILSQDFEPKSESSQKASQRWQRAVRKIIAIQKMGGTFDTNVSPGTSKGGVFKEKLKECQNTVSLIEPSEPENAISEGFQTLKMSSVEQHIMQELSRISTKVDKVNAVDQRVQVMEKQFHQHQVYLERLSDSMSRIEKELANGRPDPIKTYKEVL